MAEQEAFGVGGEIEGDCFQVIIINFKNYVSGKKALKLAKIIEKFLPNAIVAVSDFDVALISRGTKLDVYVQHVDYFKSDRATGFAIPEIVEKAGALGSLLNHSEHRLGEETIERTMKRAKQVGLKIILCVDSVRQAKRLKKLKPDAMAYEDPKLVASGKSITQYRLKEVEKFVAELKGSRIKPLCGAGIHSKWDLIAAKNLGCKGVLISSAIAHSRDADRLLGELSETAWKQ